MARRFVFLNLMFLVLVGAMFFSPPMAFAAGLSGGGYTLEDLKGLNFYKPLTSGNAEILPGLYAEYAAMGGVMQISIEPDPQSENIRISWEVSAGTPDIYYMTDSGEGEFVNNYDISKWKKIASGSVSEPGFTLLWSGGYILHTSQVGKGSPEVYYKALVAGTNPEATNPDTGNSYFAGAPAVGKVNYDLEPGFNLVGIPLEKQNTTGDYGVSDLRCHSSNDWSNSDVVYQKTSGNPTYDTAIYSATTGWNDPYNLVLKRGQGYFIKVGAAKTMTIVGDVKLSGQSEIWANGGFSIIALAVPRKIDSGEGKNLFAFSTNGDVVYKKTSAANPTYDSTQLVGGTWTLFPEVLDFKMGKGYFYYSNDTADLQAEWEYDASTNKMGSISKL